MLGIIGRQFNSGTLVLSFSFLSLSNILLKAFVPLTYMICLENHVGASVVSFVFKQLVKSSHYAIRYSSHLLHEQSGTSCPIQ